VVVVPNVAVEVQRVAAAHNAGVSPSGAVGAHTEAPVPDEERVVLICGQALPCGVAGSHFFHAVPVSLPALVLLLCQAELVDRFAPAVRFFPDDYFVQAAPGVPVAENVRHLNQVSLALQWASALAVHLFPGGHELLLVEMTGWAVRDAGRESYFFQPSDYRYPLDLPDRASDVPAGRRLLWIAFLVHPKSYFRATLRVVDHVHSELETVEVRRQAARPDSALPRQSVARAIRPPELPEPAAPQ
jgi:hypothetical protein